MRTVLVLALLAGLSSSEPKTYELPKDPKAPVLTFDYRGGYGAPRKNGKPLIAILADGTLQAAHVPAGTRLDPKRVQELLRFVLETHRLFDFDGKRVKAQMRAQRGGATPWVLDASDTVVFVAIRGRTHTARFNASTWAAQQFPTIRELQDLEAARKKLQSTVCEVQVGGREQARKLLDLANAGLKGKYPKERPLALIDFNAFMVVKDGTRRLQIIRWEKDGSAGVWVTIPKKGKPSVDLVSVQKH